jgi:N-ethylmaleimide reductase
MSKLFTPALIGPYAYVPSRRHGATDADALQSRRHSERSDGRILHAARLDGRSDRLRSVAGLDPRQRLCRRSGIYSDTQIAGWRRVTDAVHAKGGRIFSSCGTFGRQVACRPAAERRSAGRAFRHSRPRATLTPGAAKSPFSMPRALELHEISGIIERISAPAPSASLRAGFDGVEIHGANGYLPGSISCRDGTKQAHGRVRRLRSKKSAAPLPAAKVTQAAISAWCRSSALSSHVWACASRRAATYGSMSDSNPPATFGFAATPLSFRRRSISRYRRSA